MQDVPRTRMSQGGTNIGTRKLRISADGKQASFNATSFIWTLFFIWIFIGVFAPFFIVYNNITGLQHEPDLEDLVSLMFAFVFLAIGSWLLRVAIVPIVFDARHQEFTKGWGQHKQVRIGEKPKQTRVSFSDITGLQICSKRIRDSDGDYTCYELNLVLKDGSRIHVFSHGNLKTLKPDVEKLAAFLGGIPVQEV